MLKKISLLNETLTLTLLAALTLPTAVNGTWESSNNWITLENTDYFTNAKQSEIGIIVLSFTLVLLVLAMYIKKSALIPIYKKNIIIVS